MTAPQLPVVRDVAGVDRGATTTRRTHTVGEQAWRTLVERAELAGISPSLLLACVYGRTLGGWCREQRFSLGLDNAGLSLDVDADPRRSFTDCAKDIRVGNADG